MAFVHVVLVRDNAQKIVHGVLPGTVPVVQHGESTQRFCNLQGQVYTGTAGSSCCWEGGGVRGTCTCNLVTVQGCTGR